MSANDNPDSLASRARPHDDADHEGVGQLGPDPASRSSQPNAAPTHHTPSLLPDGYIQSRQANFYEKQTPTPAFPGSLVAPAPATPAFSSPIAAPVASPTVDPVAQAPGNGNSLYDRQVRPTSKAQAPAQQQLDTGESPADERPTSHPQDSIPASIPLDATVQMPGRTTPNEPIDCTVQMRGRTRDNLRVESGIPWEKSQEPVEEEEKIQALPVPPPPPSSTNNRLPAMQPPVTKEILQAQIEQQAGSGSFDAARLDAIPSPRQAVRYKPSAQTSDAVPRPKMVDPVTPKKRRSATTSSETVSDSRDTAVESKRVRINPKLLKSAESPRRQEFSSDFFESEEKELDTEFAPRRFKSLKSDDSGAFSWSEMQYLVRFYFREVKSLFINPQEFFLTHVEDTTLGEPITFMILSGGIAAVFMFLSGNVGDGISTLFGTSAYAIIAAIAVHYAMQWMGVPEGDLKSCFKILAYSQAPLLVSWIKLGSIPVGWLCAFAYGMYLCVIGMEQVFEMDRQRAIVIVAVVSVVIRGLLHLIGL